MNHEVKEKWCQALRSGEYKQCRNFFRKSPEVGSGYCCLAVLADVYIKGHSGEWNSENILILPNEESDCCKVVWDWAGLDDSNTDKCVDLNDREKLDFEQIADYVETNF